MSPLSALKSVPTEHDPTTRISESLKVRIDTGLSGRFLENRNARVLMELFRTTDAVVAVTALVGVLIVANYFYGMPEGLEQFLRIRLTVKNLIIVVFLALLWPRLFGLFGLYDALRLKARKDEIIGVAVASTVGSALVFIVPFTSVSGAFTTGAVGYFWLAVLTGTLAVRYGARRILAIPRPSAVRQLLIVGSGPRAHRLYTDLTRDPDSGFQIAGFVDTNHDIGFKDIRRQMLGSLDDLERILMRSVVDEVVIALPIRSRYEEIQETIRVCERVGVEAKYLADVFQYSLARPRYDQASGFPAVALKLVTDDQRLLIKRAIDLFCGTIGLVLLSPLMLAIALAIKLTSPGPAIFAQERYGLNKRRFTMYKFRTMVTNAEELQATLEAMNEVSGPVFKIRQDPRITLVGRFLRKTSLDELPQLFNVVRGEMSLVGPRPLPTRDVSKFSEAWPMRRFSVRPGLTCLWQISGRSNLHFEDWMVLDLRYIDTWSLSLDLTILAKTLPAVVKGRGAS